MSSNDTPTNHSDLRQQLLELIHELLPDDAAAALRARIEAEPEVARTFEEVRQTAELLREAARIEEPTVALAVPEDRQDSASLAASGAPSSIAAKLGWTAALAAGLLLAVCWGGYLLQVQRASGLERGHLRLIVSGATQLSSSGVNEYFVRAANLAGEPVPAQIEYTLLSPSGQELLRDQATCNEAGELALRLPAKVPLVGGSKFQLVALHNGQREQFEVGLAVDDARWITQLALDKPLYQPGEVVYFRSLTLSRFELDATPDQFISYEVLDPSGAPVAGSQQQGSTDHGVGNGLFQIPGNAPGGEYKLVARATSTSGPPAEQTFLVQRYRLPRIKKELEFVRDSYGPGDMVTADFSATGADGAPLASGQLYVTATVDGQAVFEGTPVTDPSGAHRIEFALPEQIQHGRGQLAVIVDDGGNRETLARTIPINLGKLDVEFFPESGDLVSEIENRIYFMARDPQGEAVDIAGQIIDDRGRKLTQVETGHEGMGRFTLTPTSGRSYHLQITRPAGVTFQPQLPGLSGKQHVLVSTERDVFGPDQPLELAVNSRRHLPLVLAVYCRGVQIAQRPLNVEAAKKATVQIDIPAEFAGVLKATVFDCSEAVPQPVAERLVYRRPQRKLDIQVADASERYTPGDPVELNLMVRNEQGEPVQGVLGVSVVDESMLNLADDDTPAMPTYFLLSSEVEHPADLEKADFYLSPGTESEQALDLLLGTQGWRRFAQRSLRELQEQGDLDPESPLVELVNLDGPDLPPTVYDNLPALTEQYERKREELAPRYTKQFASLGFLVGAVLLVTLGMVSILHYPGGARLYGSLAAGSLAFVMAGVAWLNLSAPPSQSESQLAYHPFLLKVRAVQSPPRSGRASGMELESDEAATIQGMKTFADQNFDGVELYFFNAKPDDGGFNYEFDVNGNLADGRRRWRDAKLRGLLLGEAGGMGGGGGFGMNDYFDGFFRGGPRGGQARGWGIQDHFRIQQELEQLRQLDDLGDQEVKALERRLEELQEAIAVHRFTVREYAHQHRHGEPGVRSDFAETLYWHPLLVTDDQGRAKINFELSDSLTTFRVLAEGHAAGGRLGSSRAQITSALPFSLEPKLPLEVNAGDRIDLPLAVTNSSAEPLPVALTLTHSELFATGGELDRTLKLEPGQHAREFFSLDVVGQTGVGQVSVTGSAGNLSDAIRRTVTVVPPGFPVHESYSGRLSGPSGEQELMLDLPASWVPGSLEVSLAVYPSTLAELQQGMESILQQPSGCFEQASTSNYPNVLALQYMQEHRVANPDVTRRAKELLAAGYGKLAGYECKQKGYEWFGSDPGHEALTAYGLMEFRDMAEVYDVDSGMLDRTAQWLLSRRDGKGGFERNSRALDSFGQAPQDITNAYIVWALAESGQTGIETEIAHVGKLAEASVDPYLVALSAAALLEAGQGDQGRRLLEKLSGLQQEDGHLAGKQGSITRSGGFSLQVETTALAALAWMKDAGYRQPANRAVEWIVKSRTGSGGFGSTQGTILALKALVEHAKVSRATVTGGTLLVKRADAVVGQQEFRAGHQSTLQVDGIEASLEPGANSLRISISGDNEMPYALDVSYRTLRPVSDDACVLRLTTELGAERVKAGETVPLSAQLTNTTDQGQPMSMVILGLPAGLEPRADQLKELKEAGRFDYYETRAREVILYWRDLAPSEMVDLQLDLVAAVPGKYTGPASRTYLYYTAEQQQWCEPLSVEITRE